MWTKARGAGPGGADAGSSRQEKSGTGTIALLLADLARRKHRQPEMWYPPGNDKSAALRATKALPRPRKGAPKGKSRSVGQKVFAAGARKRRIPSEKQTEGLARGQGQLTP